MKKQRTEEELKEAKKKYNKRYNEKKKPLMSEADIEEKKNRAIERKKNRILERSKLYKSPYREINNQNNTVKVSESKKTKSFISKTTSALSQDFDLNKGYLELLKAKENIPDSNDLSPKHPVAIKKPQELSLKKSIIPGKSWRKA